MDNLTEMFLKNMEAISDEEKEPCIHCGDVWYRIHHKDGVCHKCQQLGKQGRAELVKREQNFYRVLMSGALIIALFLILKVMLEV
jgi:hypothetical protein